GAVLYEVQVHWGIWLLWFINGFVWPHLAYLLALRSRTPFHTEHRHLLFDSATGGVWVVVMGFNPLASCMIIMMMWMNNIAAGGVRLFVKGVGTSLAGFFLGFLTVGLVPNLAVTNSLVYACLPLLVAYPLAVGSITYRLAIQLHKQKELLQRLSRTDGLTGLYNRRYWEIRTEDLIAQARRHPQPLSLVLLDVDHFKTINDTYGHSVGDQVLQQIARQLQANLRETELLGRYGGEEFAVVLPNAGAEAAVATAERLRRVIALTEFGAQQLSCTISLGVVTWEDGFSDYAGWFRAADQALYHAKDAGRNTVIVYGERGKGAAFC
ncbi:MAG TPA: diguanylate cyclase, partial [Cellvibrio sp.]|nr:diguanylate cyclase [Cellvibrio sp.]